MAIAENEQPYRKEVLMICSLQVEAIGCSRMK